MNRTSRGVVDEEDSADSDILSSISISISIKEWNVNTVLNVLCVVLEFDDFQRN